MLTTALDAMEVTQTGKWEPTEIQINKFNWIHSSPFPEKGAEKNNHGIKVNKLTSVEQTKLSQNARQKCTRNFKVYSIRRDQIHNSPRSHIG